MADTEPYNEAESTYGKVRVVREAIEKIIATGTIGTINLERCVKHLKAAEQRIERRDEAIKSMRNLLGVDE